MKHDKREKRDSFSLPTRPGILAGFYFSCGPLAGLGFLIGDVQGFVLALVSNVLFWVVIDLLKENIHYK
jgi:hypothetical protein